MTSLIDKILDLYINSPNVAILMSGKGSNADCILKNSHKYNNVNFISIITDNKNSNAYTLSKTYNTKYYCIDDKIKTSNDRKEYFLNIKKYLIKNNINTLIYAGFMKISPEFFVKEFPGINVHPADLTIKNDLNAPKYTGMQAIKNAINGNESYLASTAHVVDSEVDCGAQITVSKKLHLNKNKNLNISEIHEKLKINCEHDLYPLTIELLSKGKLFKKNLPYTWDQLINQFKKNHDVFFTEKLAELFNTKTPLDSLYLAQNYSSQINFDLKNIEDVFKKVIEEFNELKDAFKNRATNKEHFIEEIGDCFFTLVNLCKFIPMHPDKVIKNSLDKYIKRCKFIENRLKEKNLTWIELSENQILDLWQQAKKYVKKIK
ncbi:formyltransferase family protein [Gammaproteobacteria bacterium]|nr:formyltransferase family protein [Gammaproteobacteria bacterium]